mgnify:CR=1 FL=1
MKEDEALYWNPEAMELLARTGKAGMRTWHAAAGSMRSGDQRIGKIKDLAAAAGVSENTIRRGLQQLEASGLITRDRLGARIIPESVAYIGPADPPSNERSDG